MKKAHFRPCSANTAAFRKPFLKWAGGKYRILDKIIPRLPSAARFVEPFAGSCAVYLNVPAAKALICDANRDLIALFKNIQEEGEAYIRYCEEYFLPENNTGEAFYAFRERFNASADPRERGALLLYLNRHAYNGLVRYNSKGRYNAPFGKYKAPYFPLTELRAFHRKTRETDTEFVACDFRAAFARMEPGDVAYCDPPYVSLTRTANFTAYSGGAFGICEHQDLAALSKAAGEKGIPVLISNHDTDVVRDLYASAEITRFEVQRFISCKGNSRAAAPELLAAFAARLT